MVLRTEQQNELFVTFFLQGKPELLYLGYFIFT